MVRRLRGRRHRVGPRRHRVVGTDDRHVLARAVQLRVLHRPPSRMRRARRRNVDAGAPGTHVQPDGRPRGRLAPEPADRHRGRGDPRRPVARVGRLPDGGARLLRSLARLSRHRGVRARPVRLPRRGGGQVERRLLLDHRDRPLGRVRRERLAGHGLARVERGGELAALRRALSRLGEDRRDRR